MARPRKKVSITWLGEDHLHFDEDGNQIPNSHPPMVNVWNGIRFPKGEPVEIDNPHMIMKAKANPFYEVDGKQGGLDSEEEISG